MTEGRFVLNFTPTGLIPTREMTPHVPITPQEIVSDVSMAAGLGASIIHLHARDPATGEPTHDNEVYAEIIRGIRTAHPALVLCISTSGRAAPDFERRSACLDLDGDAKPDMASLTLSSLNFNRQASLNPPQIIRDLAAKMQQRGIKPELEAFDAGMINYAKYLLRKGILSTPCYFNLILGNIACAQADPLHLGLMIHDLPPDSIWSVGGVGRDQFKVHVMGLASGGGVRVGLEDNVWYDNERTHLATNRELLERVLGVADAMGLAPSPPADVRTMLDLDAPGGTE